MDICSGLRHDLVSLPQRNSNVQVVALFLAECTGHLLLCVCPGSPGGRKTLGMMPCYGPAPLKAVVTEDPSPLSSDVVFVRMYMHCGLPT